MLDFASFVPLRKLILVFGLLNATLYAALLPLWEGFDEAFHYSYVQTLWQTRRLPVLGQTLIASDVSESFRLAPVSHIVHSQIPATTSFDNWFSLPEMEKQRRRTGLDLLRPGSGRSSGHNYEAHHPPLAYLCLAVVDRLIEAAPITVRVLTLRLFAAALSVSLLYFGMANLCRTLMVPECFANAALFTLFCSEMLYATVAHVANDWLAVGLSALFIAALAEFVRQPDRQSSLRTALWLTAGLLTKAYFLAFAVLSFGTAVVIVWRRRTSVRTVLAGALFVLAPAGPWYVRNLILYKNVSGTQEAFDGIGLAQALAAAPRIDWVATAGYLARASLWTGNNSFTSFSRGTLNVMLALLVLALAAWVLHNRLIRPPERIVLAAILLFSCAIAYATCASFAHTNGESAGASPWYTQVLLAPVLALAYLGMSRSKTFGIVLAVGTTALWAWVLMATWIVKLFPMYSGAGAASMRLQSIWVWYSQQAGAHMSDLSLLALAPAPLLYAGMSLSVTLTILLSAATIRSLTASLRHHRAAWGHSRTR